MKYLPRLILIGSIAFALPLVAQRPGGGCPSLQCPTGLHPLPERPIPL